MTKYFQIFICFLFLASCENNHKGTIDNHNEILSEINQNDDTRTISEVEEILNTIPSSNEITATIKASGAPYSGLVINNPVNADSYTTHLRKAINLGIYSTDLGYISAYDNSLAITEHLKVINDLASDMNLDHLINKKKIDNLISNGHLSDSIFDVSSKLVTNICHHLHENERHEISVLLLIGGWLEAVHLATSIAYNSKINNPNLNSKIGAQKDILNKFIIVLEKYKDNQFFNNLLTDFTRLKKLYQDVNVVSPKSNSDTTKIIIPINETEISEVQLAQITIQLSKIRDEIINPT